ncbi:MAG: thioredoxin domain-containing protein [Chloroflexi bacterium]|nr:thioredoxin domain-containing protein [Chloroflexota bacterium]
MEKDIIATYVNTGKVRLVLRPIGVGGQSTMAAEATECADAQGGFLDLYNALFGNFLRDEPLAFTNENLKDFAAGAGLDGDALEACLEGTEHEPLIQQELEAAAALGVQYTPTVFINGEAVVGLMTYDVYAEKIEAALAAITP